MQNSSASLLTAVVTGIVVFFFAVAWTAYQGARKGLATAKAGVGTARKTFWTSLGSLIKMGVWLVVLVFALVAWLANDVRSDSDVHPTPSPSVTRR